MTITDPTPAQMTALRTFKRMHGRYWKDALRRQWARASADPELQSLRNTHGPKWLKAFLIKD